MKEKNVKRKMKNRQKDGKERLEDVQQTKKGS